MRVLVTGCSGFIGQHLAAELLRRGYDVVGIDIRSLEKSLDKDCFFVCDLREEQRVKSIIADCEPDVVLHLAARTDLDGPSLSDYAANIEGVQNLVEAIKNCPSVKRCIYTSSQLVCEIGYMPQNDRDYKPNTLYGQSKVLTEEIVRENNGGHIEWAIVRPTTIWGPGMSAHYQRFFRSIWQGWYFHVGRRPLFKSYGYVGNTVHQYIQLMEASAEKIHQKVFYLADYEPISLRLWADSLQKELGARPIFTLPEPFAKLLARTGDLISHVGVEKFPFNSFRLRNVLTEYQFDLTATQSVCGTLPFSMSEGIKQTAAWLVDCGIVKK